MNGLNSEAVGSTDEYDLGNRQTSLSTSASSGLRYLYSGLADLAPNISSVTTTLLLLWGVTTEAESRRPAPTRTREVAWLNENQEGYRGQWVVVEGERVIAHGLDYLTVRRTAIHSGIEVPFIIHVPDEPIRYHFMGL
ncbi:MAG: hypothetical protein HY644_04235 [Acidobacteria bacterium]|nr:hypothetical protein [Acidobacteriota bacterium]